VTELARVVVAYVVLCVVLFVRGVKRAPLDEREDSQQ